MRGTFFEFISLGTFLNIDVIHHVPITRNHSHSILLTQQKLCDVTNCIRSLRSSLASLAAVVTWKRERNEFNFWCILFQTIFEPNQLRQPILIRKAIRSSKTLRIHPKLRSGGILGNFVFRSGQKLWYQEMNRSLQLVIRNEISLIRRKNLVRDVEKNVEYCYHTLLQIISPHISTVKECQPCPGICCALVQIIDPPPFTSKE